MAPNTAIYAAWRVQQLADSCVYKEQKMNVKPKKCVAGIKDRLKTKCKNKLIFYVTNELSAEPQWHLATDAHNDDLFRARFKTMWGKLCTITSEKQNNVNDKTHSSFVDT